MHGGDSACSVPKSYPLHPSVKNDLSGRLSHKSHYSGLDRILQQAVLVSAMTNRRTSGLFYKSHGSIVYEALGCIKRFGPRGNIGVRRRISDTLLGQ